MVIYGYIKAFPCPFRMQHLNPSSLSIEKSLPATAFTFMFCLRICCALPIQVISSSLPIGFCFNSSGYSFPSLSIPSKAKPQQSLLRSKGIQLLPVHTSNHSTHIPLISKAILQESENCSYIIHSTINLY